MKYHFIALILLLSLLSEAQNIQETKLSNEDKIYGLSLVWQEVNYNFAYLNDYNINWDSVYIANIPKVITAESLIEYYSILSKIMNSFHEGHTTIDLPKELKEGDYYGNIAISCFYSNGSFYVKAFGKEYENKIFLGSKIIEINNLEPNEYFEKYVFPNFNIAEHSAKSYLSQKKLFEGLIKDSLHIKIQNPDKNTVTLNLKREPIRNKIEYEFKTPEIVTDSSFNFKQIDGISYVKIGTFLNNEASSGFIQNIDKLKNSTGIILDLRNNSGGNSQFATNIVQYFTDKNKFNIWYGWSKANNSYYRAISMYNRLNTDSSLEMKAYYDRYADYATYSHFDWGMQYEIENKSIGELKGIPVVVLVNSKTASSGETFIIQLKQVMQITVIGEPSFGSTTTPLIIPLPGGGFVWIASQKSQNEKGETYTYIKPDITHQPSVKDVLIGKDKILEIALDWF